MRKHLGNQQHKPEPVQKDDSQKHRSIDPIDQKWMQKCLHLAKKSEKQAEVPVGCLILSPEGRILAQSGNIRETKKTPLGHAELVCLHRASQKLQSWRLAGCTLYVTLEPCTMCAAAIMQARISRVVFGAYDPKAGALGSVIDLSRANFLHHKIEVQGGILKDECSEQLKAFFKKRRSEKRIERAR